jgi:hypothetical protein
LERGSWKDPRINVSKDIQNLSAYYIFMTGRRIYSTVIRKEEFRVTSYRWFTAELCNGC